MPLASLSDLSRRLPSSPPEVFRKATYLVATRTGRLHPPRPPSSPGAVLQSTRSLIDVIYIIVAGSQHHAGRFRARRAEMSCCDLRYLADLDFRCNARGP